MLDPSRWSMTQEEFEKFLSVAQYGDFTFTEAIRPVPTFKIKPKNGFKREIGHDKATEEDLPILMITASAEIIFELFLQLIKTSGMTRVGVVLETSHDQLGQLKEVIGRPTDTLILESKLYGFEELLLHDGRTGILVASLNEERYIEFSLDEHKMIVIYNWTLMAQDILDTLDLYGIYEDPELDLIINGGHIHATSELQRREFWQMAREFGYDGEAPV